MVMVRAMQTSGVMRITRGKLYDDSGKYMINNPESNCSMRFLLLYRIDTSIQLNLEINYIIDYRCGQV